MIERRRTAEVVPQYSLTGDLLSYLRCGLQYRYLNGSSLPPSRPVQLWFGQFIHGVMESAFRLWQATPTAFPWPMNITPYGGPTPLGRVPHDIGLIGEAVEQVLHALGTNPRSANLRLSGYQRAFHAVNELGPHLFPLIQVAEEKVVGTRELPPNGPPGLRCSRYELHGVIDVLTHLTLATVPATNIVRAAVAAAIPNLPPAFEVIVDYKGSRRPRLSNPYWMQGEWQVQTYAWLRTRQPQALPVSAGVLLYVNELAPGRSEVEELKRAVAQGDTDVVPPPGSRDAYLLNTWTPGAAIPPFSQGFLLQRAVRVIQVNAASQQQATSQFDAVVVAIENCVKTEAAAGNIMAHWQSCGDDESCVACDFRHFCPNPAPRGATLPVLQAPSAP